MGITLDSGHFHAAGVDWKQLIRRFPDRILNFHVKDQIADQSTALGAGDVDLKGYIQELDAIGYEGVLAIELEVQDYENLPRYLCRSIRVHERNCSESHRTSARESGTPMTGLLLVLIVPSGLQCVRFLFVVILLFTVRKQFIGLSVQSLLDFLVLSKQLFAC